MRSILRRVWTFPLLDSRPAWGDAIVFAAMAALLYVGARLALGAPEVVRGPDISLTPSAVPIYAALSLLRMTAAYGLSILFSLVYGLVLTVSWLTEIPSNGWIEIGRGTGATLLRASAALAIALAWTLPVGVAIGLNPRLAAVLQPVVQIAASVPATALFPILLMLVVDVPGGMNMASVLLMLLGTQWYLLFNIIAGASALPQDLQDTAALLQLGRWERWRTLILPALFPYLVTGAITSTGGAWNASIVAEYTTFAGRTLSTEGLGALIAEATADGNYPLPHAATLTMILTVVLINRLAWRPLYRLGETRYRLD